MNTNDTTERDVWLINLEHNRDNGTLARIDAAVENRTPVQIKRSSGEMVTGYVFENVSVVVQVTWGEGAEQWTRRDGGYRIPQGCKSKRVQIEDFLQWNPALAGREQA